MTKNTCYFPLYRIWNIHLETTENSISRFLDFNIFWGSKLPRETPRGSRLWRWQYFPLLRNIRISTNTPSQTPATRLLILNKEHFQYKQTFTYSTNILVRLLTVNLKNCLTPKIRKFMCDPILLNMRPHYCQSSRENATPFNGTSPLASYGEGRPPGLSHVLLSCLSLKKRQCSLDSLREPSFNQKLGKVFRSMPTTT